MLSTQKSQPQLQKLTTYQTHVMIKSAIPDAVTVYDRENKGQMTIDEWLDIVNNRGLNQGDQYEI